MGFHPIKTLPADCECVSFGLLCINPSRLLSSTHKHCFLGLHPPYYSPLDSTSLFQDSGDETGHKTKVIPYQE